MRENYRTDEKNDNLTKLDSLKRILSYFSCYRVRVAVIILMITAMSIIVASIPLFTQKAIDVDIKNGDIKGLFTTVFIALFLCLVWWILSVFKWHILAKMTNEIVYKIRKETYDNVLKLSLDFFDTRPSGRILARLVGDMEGLKTITQQLVNDFIPNVVLLLLILFIMAFNNFQLAISAFVILPILSFFSYWIIFKGYPNWERFRKKESNHTSFVFESYSGIRTIQSFLAEEETEKEEDRILDDLFSSWRKAVKFGDSLNIITLTCQGLGYFLLFLFAVKWLRLGTGSVGEILAYTGYLSLFWQPIRALASMYTQLVNNLASASRVFALMDEKPSLVEVEGAKDIVIKEGRVEFENISFAYPDEKDRVVIQDVSFSIEGGKRIALVGPTGAGKTTIINLIARFYDPIEGKILIDGEDIAKVTFSSLRNAIALMPQDSMLFSGTIKDNLLYGKSVSDDEMKRACSRLGIDNMLSSLSNGYDTKIEDAMLSQGQRQLIALARTLIADPRILILDEATSNVDTNTEILVQNGLDILMKGRTSFTVAHRLSTIKASDEIFVISNKGISERGNHQELMALGGEYKELYESQFSLID